MLSAEIILLFFRPFHCLPLSLWCFLALSYTAHGDNNTSKLESLDLRCTRCNVIFLNFDFLRADFIGLLNGSDFTQNIDSFFHNSVIFENVSSPAGSSYRGNLSVMTATEPHIYDIDVNSFHSLQAAKNLGPWEPVFKGNTTIAQLLSKAGYYTINLNKGIRSGRSTFLDRGFDQYKQFNIRLVIEDLLPSLHQSLSSARRPFFLLFHPVPTRLHRAFYPLHRRRIQDEDIIYTEYKIDNKPYGYKVLRSRKPSLLRQRIAEHKIYGQQLRYADDKILDTFSFLEDLLDDSIIVLYSNHGTQLGDKGIFASNGVSYQSSVHVPLFIRHPAVTRPIRISTPVSLIDLAPTVYEFLGMTKPAESTGISLAPLITGGSYSREFLVGKNDPDEYIRAGNWKLIIRYRQDRALYDQRKDPMEKFNIYDSSIQIARRLEYIVNFGSSRSNPIFDGGWKLVINDQKEFELYNLESDPGETRNLANLYPQKRDALSAKLDEFKLQARQRMRNMVKD